MFDVICDRIYESYKDACILYIDQVVNELLLERYNTFKLIHQDDPRYKEYQVFHGTDKDSIRNIAFNGFDISYNTTSAHGKGTYFADKAHMSMGYTTSKEINRRYKQSKGTQICYMFFSKIYHTGPSAPGIHVVSTNEATYPEYIVAFSYSF